MKGSELRCPECGAGAADVDPDIDVDDMLDYWSFTTGWAVEWGCTNGHRYITGTGQYGQEGPLTHMKVRHSK